MNKFNKNIFNNLQSIKEILGKVDEADITALPNDYIELEVKLDKLEILIKNLLKVIKNPFLFNLQEQSDALWSKITQQTNNHQSTTHSHSISRVAATSALEFGELDPLGLALTKFAEAHDKIGSAQLVQDNDILISFLQPWQTTLDTSIQLAKNARNTVKQSRLWLDSCKQSLKSASPQKVEQARLEMESAEDKLVTQTETALTLMKNVLENPEPLTSLNNLVKALVDLYSKTYSF